MIRDSIMIPVLLTRIKTRDGVALEGIAVLPKKSSGRALIYLHGLDSRFSSGQILIKELSERCRACGIAYFKFNTRGHDAASGGNPKSKKMYGGGFEKFEECVFDIRAMVAFARKLGHRQIILAGHSTGANKALYYLCKTKDRSVKGLLLLGPVNDMAAGRKKFGVVGLTRGVALAEKLLKKSSEALMPQSYGVISARRFLSMFLQGGAEDVFPYLNLTASWKELESVRIPVAVIFGTRDEYLNRPAREIIDIFRAHARWTKKFSGIIIEGAGHGFRKREKELAVAVIRSINGL